MSALIQGVQIAVVGMGVVFIALTGISIILSYFYLLDQIVDRGKAKKPEVSQKTSEPTPALSPAGEISPQLIAVISAAVAVAIEQKVQIKHIRYRRGPADQTWAVQGRATVMGSHAIKPE
jgi:sodium pump decarboxylase gamma subunit